MEREDRQLFNCKKKLEPPSSCLSPKIFTQVGAMMKRLFDKYPRKGKKISVKVQPFQVSSGLPKVQYTLLLLEMTQLQT